jgi:DNA invertase Pin-like site-specific DNA recombinase
MQGVIYTRVSSDEQVKGMSLEFQREDCLRYAQEKNISIAKLYEERGESAKFTDRPELLNLLDYCKKNKGKIHVLIVWKLDRLSRNQMDYYFIKRTLLGYGVSLHSATEPSIEDSSSIAGKIFETFSALQAEIDNTVRRDRAIRGMAAKIASGIYPWQPPLGYISGLNRLKGLKKTEPDEPDPERFPLIKRLFATCREQRIANSVTLAKLANSWGLKTGTGKRVYPQLVDRILDNGFYSGVLTNPWSKAEAAGKHEPAVSREDFFTIQWLRKGKALPLPEAHRAEHPDFPLRRTVKCSACASSLTGSWSRGNGGKYAYYHCARKRCTWYGKAVKKSDLEHEFLRKLADVSPQPARLALLKRVVMELWEEDQTTSEDSARRNAKRLQEAEERLERLITMKERELLTDEEFLSRKGKLRIEIAAASVSSGDLHVTEDGIESALDFTGQFVSSLPSQWFDMSSELRRRFQKSIFPEGIAYHRGKGFGTTKLGLIYEISRESGGSKIRLVHLVRASWNQLLEELHMIAEIGRDLAASKQSSS